MLPSVLKSVFSGYQWQQLTLKGTKMHASTGLKGHPVIRCAVSLSLFWDPLTKFLYGIAMLKNHYIPNRYSNLASNRVRRGKTKTDFISGKNRNTFIITNFFIPTVDQSYKYSCRTDWVTCQQICPPPQCLNEHWQSNQHCNNLLAAQHETGRFATPHFHRSSSHRTQ